jgi:transposase-like protein
MEQPMNCPKCGSQEYTKNGIVSGRQRYRCKQCQYNYTVTQKSNAITETLRRRVLQTYLEGVGFRGIGRIFGISCTSAMMIVKQYGKTVKMPMKKKPVKTAEIR